MASKQYLFAVDTRQIDICVDCSMRLILMIVPTYWTQTGGWTDIAKQLSPCFAVDKLKSVP